jgi:periplasmic divalent cation tolerance protein
MTEERFIFVLTSVAGEVQARKIAKAILKEKAAACVTITDVASSFYHWKGKIESAKEYLLLIKTTRPAYSLLEKTILKNHPYEVPEIIALPILKGHAPYLKWIEDSIVKPVLAKPKPKKKRRKS